MPRQNRVFHADKLYEIVPRAREGLPFPPTRLTNELLGGILARTQRDHKAILSNFVDMNNHAHQLCIPQDPALFSKFYMEYQKKASDTVRKLTKRRRLNLWESRPSVALVSGLKDVINRLVYIFLNPAKAGLVDNIDDYPGLSSWKAFTTCEPTPDAEFTIKAHWLPASRLEPLPHHNRLSPANDLAMVNKMKSSKHVIEYDLVVKPFAWAPFYGVTKTEDIESIRQNVIARVREEEAALRRERIEKGIGIIGTERLRNQEYMRPHTPKTKSRRIFVICEDDEERPRIIQTIKAIHRKCRECYRALKEGKPHEWPPGTFIPWLPPSVLRPASWRT